MTRRRVALSAYLLLTGSVAALLSLLLPPPPHHRLSDQDFWKLIVELSEPGQTFQPSGEYQSDNLVSNERSIQDVLPSLGKRPNGAYIGVGPEQNFTYLAFLDPGIAFIVDIRRANLLEHLLYKGLFELSANRLEFVSRLFGRERIDARSSALTASDVMTSLRRARQSDLLAEETLGRVIERLVRWHGFALSREDMTQIRAIYRQFCAAGPDLRWSSDTRDWIPTFAELMVQRGDDGMPHGFLASEESFRTVRAMQQENRVVPIVGDFGGTHALRGIARYLIAHHLRVDVFYTSNVEPYLRGEAVGRFFSNVAALPADDKSVLVRTRFHWTGGSAAKPDYVTSTAAAPLK